MNTPDRQQMTTDYQTDHVAHLAWSLTSPSLTALTPNEHFHALLKQSQQANLEWLNTLDLQPSPLFDYLNTHNHRLLGSYFECLWQFYFSHHPDWQLLEHHVQIFDASKKQTLGELDLLVQHIPSGRYFHLELAAKFYLRHPEHTGLNEEHWLGPQSNDRLDLKLNKLHQKQLPFLFHDATKTSLIERQLNHEYEQAMIMKGYLFHPWQKRKSLPKCAHHQTLTGYWLHSKDANKLLTETENIQWAILPKHNWLGLFSDQHNQQLINPTNIILANIDTHFKTSPYKHALMLIMLKDTEKGLTEAQRFMLVHDDWPNKAC